VTLSRRRFRLANVSIEVPVTLEKDISSIHRKGDPRMLSTQVTIERSPQVVWDYLTEPQNWKTWWGGGLKSAQWREGGKLDWEEGGTSRVEAIVPAQMMRLAGPWMTTTFTPSRQLANEAGSGAESDLRSRCIESHSPLEATTNPVNLVNSVKLPCGPRRKEK
jgi:hypothetical protein